MHAEKSLDKRKKEIATRSIVGFGQFCSAFPCIFPRLLGLMWSPFFSDDILAYVGKAHSDYYSAHYVNELWCWQKTMDMTNLDTAYVKYT